MFPNELLLWVGANLIPLLAIVFVCALIIYKIYIKIRSKFDARVNCWFCNENTRVPYSQSNSWTCPNCEQYNGFTKDGDYNREDIIFQQLNCSNASSKSSKFAAGTLPSQVTAASAAKTNHNGFCAACNEAQRIKVEKLAQFEPKNESHFDEELREYKAKLEKNHRLCDTCERHLKRVLRDKKKMVLGSKFLDFIMKGAEKLKEPHVGQECSVWSLKWKRRVTWCVGLISLYQMVTAFSLLPALGREQVIGCFGPAIGQPLFVVLSPCIAFWRVLVSYVSAALRHDLLLKISLFNRTIFHMLLYSMGFKLAEASRYNLASLLETAAPFALMLLTFGYHLVDGMKLNRYTVMLCLWSSIAGGLIQELPIVEFTSALLTFVLAVSDRRLKDRGTDTNSQSFHRIYSEDYLSDEDTISMLSQQFDCSSVSQSSQHEFLQQRQHMTPSQRGGPRSEAFFKSPSMVSLQQFSQPQHSPMSLNSSFSEAHNFARRPDYAMNGFPVARRPTAPPAMQSPSLFSSNLELLREDTEFGPNTPAPLNASFAESSYCPPQPNAMDPRSIGAFPRASVGPEYDRMFSNPFNRTPVNPRPSDVGGFAKPQLVPSGLSSPFSMSSNSLYSRSRAPSVLAPSRFGNTMQPTTSWLSGGYFNQRDRAFEVRSALVTTNHGHGGPTHTFGEPRSDENLSRASSRSSGFESQTGRVNLSRENSLSRDAVDPMQRSVSMDIGATFRPIASAANEPPGQFQRRGPLHFPQAPTEEFAEGFGNERCRSAFRGRDDRDSFNLHKITEDLPPIKRGDLLRKWKEDQMAVS